MGKKINLSVISDASECVLLLAMMAGLVIFPSDCVNAASESITLCLSTVIPSLFPFFVISETAVRRGYTRYFGRIFKLLMKPLFGLRGECAAVFALGLTGGYPVGARTAAAMYRAGQCSKGEAEYMLSFCNNCGPAFILGTVGAGIFGSAKIGLILYLFHILSAAAVGVLLRGLNKKTEQIFSVQSAKRDIVSFPAAFTGAVRSSVLSVINITGFIVLFGTVLKLMDISGVTAYICGGDIWRERIIVGMTELSNGVLCLKGSCSPAAVSAAAFMLGWGGLCVHLQTLSEISESGLSVRKYFVGKLLHGLISALMTYSFWRFLMPEYTSCFSAADVIPVFHDSPAALAAVSSAVCTALTAFFAHKIKKSGKEDEDVI